MVKLLVLRLGNGEKMHAVNQGRDRTYCGYEIPDDRVYRLTDDPRDVTCGRCQLELVRFGVWSEVPDPKPMPKPPKSEHERLIEAVLAEVDQVHDDEANGKTAVLSDLIDACVRLREFYGGSLGEADAEPDCDPRNTVERTVVNEMTVKPDYRVRAMDVARQLVRGPDADRIVDNLETIYRAAYRLLTEEAPGHS